MLTNKQQFQTKQGKWSKYTHLDFFDRCNKCREEANLVDLTKVNLNAKELEKIYLLLKMNGIQ